MMQDTATKAADAAAVPTAEKLTEVVGEATKAAASDPVGTLARMSESVGEWLIAKGPGIALALVLFVAAWVVAATVRRVILNVTRRANMDITLGKFLGNLAKWAIIIFALITVAGTLGISTTGFAAAVGAAGLAIGLALQGNLGNLASGVLLLIFRPFKVGDAVIVAGQSGVVDGIDLFTTNLDTVDNRRIIVPNGAIFSGVIENQTHHERRAITVNVATSPVLPMEKTEAAVRGMASRAGSIPGVLADPAPAVALAEIAPNVVWSLTVWASTGQFLAVRAALLREVRETLDREGVAPPVPVQLVKQVV